MTFRLLMTGLAAASLAACAMTGEREDELAKFLETNKLTGETRTCLSLSRLETLRPIVDGAFLAETRTGERYLSRVSPSCGAGGRDAIVQYSTSLTSLCRGEIIQLIDRSTGFAAGSCGLGEFEELAD